MWYSINGPCTEIQSLPALCVLQLQSFLQDSRVDTKDNALDYLKAIHKILESLYEKFDEPVNIAWLMFNFYKFCAVMTEML